MEVKSLNQKIIRQGRRKLLIYQSQVSILGPVGYGPTTLPLRHSDLLIRIAISLF